MRGAAGLCFQEKVEAWPGVVAKESKINGFVVGLDMGTGVLGELRMSPVCFRPVMVSFIDISGSLAEQQDLK